MPGSIEFMKKPHTVSMTKGIMHDLFREWFFNKFKALSEPQKYSIFNIHSRVNTLISSPTGSGKTLSAFGAILNELIDASHKQILEDKIYAVYISPLKALSNDIEKNLKEPMKEMEELACKELGIRIAVRTGDTTQKQKADMLKNPPHILITTPESLAILLSSAKFSEHLRNVEWCVVDEIHALAENKRGVHLSLSLERLSKLSDHMCRIGLSATVAPLERIAHFLVGEGRDCKVVDVQMLKKMDLKVLSPLPDLIDTTFAKTHNALYKLLDGLIQEHKTTLIFTNTRAATERVVHHLREKYPKNYSENIGAHHGSLSKEHRQDLEKRLREGKLKCVVCSTSLELGIDIGFIDLVICLGSPKSVARALQRIGRSGHKLHETTKGRIIVLDRDDLIECSVLLKAAMERKIDRVHIPQNCLDVLAQQIYGMAIDSVWEEKELFEVVKKSYCYRKLPRKDFDDIMSYLAGEFSSLEDRHIYAKIWRNEGKVGRRGKLARVIYMTNIGTIPDESYITVKIGDKKIGKLDENFLERMKPGDVFVLGGSTYRYKFARGMTAQVQSSAGSQPTVPRWVSEMLPLSFDLAMEIGKFKRLMHEKFSYQMSKEDIKEFINNYLYVDEYGAEAVYNYCAEQYNYCKKMGTDRTILIENYHGEHGSKIIFHTLYGRRVNDCLSRAVGYVLGKTYGDKAVEIGINDNGFYIAGNKKMNVRNAFEILKAEKLDILMSVAIEKSEAFKRRFRHCAGRALMILRNYMGRRKRVGRQQVSSMILFKALQRIDPNFSIVKEAKREVLEDLMDIENAREIIDKVESGDIQLEEIQTSIPTPFAFNIALMGVVDVLKMEDRVEFLKRMHDMVRAKISLGKT